PRPVDGLPHLLSVLSGVSFSLRILRADRHRWDNRAFATLGLLDASMALFRGVPAASGGDIADYTIMWPCAALSPLLAWWSIEFAYSFPFNRKLPWRWRWPLLAWTGSTIAA